jgi:ATP-dependent Lon protease
MSESKQAKDKGGKEIYPVLPLRDIVVFPYMIVPLFVGREKSINALEEVMRADKQILLAAQKNAGDDDPAPDAIYQMGTLASVLQLLKLPDGTVKVLVEGTARAKVVRYTANPDYFEAEVERIADSLGTKEEIEGTRPFGGVAVRELRQAQQEDLAEVLGTISQIEDYSKLADTIASHLAIKIADKQDILEITTVSTRLERVYTLMESEISVLQVEKKIRSRVKRQMEKTQREYYLNEQMKAIQKELGDGDERDDIQEFEEKIENTKLSKEARDKALAELKKLKQMSPMSAEATVVRNYLDWLLSIPWGIKGKVKKDLARGPGGSRQGALWPGEGQRAHRRVPGGADAHQQAERPDPVPGRPSGRRQDLARHVDRQCHGPRVRAHVARRRARRGGDPRAPAHLHRLDAGQGDPVHEEGQADQLRSSSWMRSTRWAPDFRGDPRRRCSRC